MDVMKVNLASGQNAALITLAFLQTDCRNSAYRDEVLSLNREVNRGLDINYNDQMEASPEDGDLETDGHLCSSITAALDGIEPSVELQQPGNHADIAALQQIAEQLRDIAAQLEHNVVAQATQNLSRNINRSQPQDWKGHLSSEVDRAMKQGVSLRDLSQELVVVALTLTLVKKVCEQTPRLLKSLFNTALQCITAARPR